MAYCTIIDVQGFNASRGAYSATTKPTSTQVNTMIDMIAAEIDSILTTRGVTTPVTSPADLVTYLRRVNALGAAADAESAMLPSATKASPHLKDLRDQYEAALELLRNEESSTLTVGLLPWSYLGELTGSSDEPECYFEQDKVF